MKRWMAWMWKMCGIDSKVVTKSDVRFVTADILSSHVFQLNDYCGVGGLDLYDDTYLNLVR